MPAGLSQLPNPYHYFDWAATTPLRPEVAQSMLPFLGLPCPMMSSGEAPAPEYFNQTSALFYGGNANALHQAGRFAFSLLEDARERSTKSLGARRPQEIVFTSGATESNNAIVSGVVAWAKEQARLKGIKDFCPHIITSAIEHDAILAAVKRAGNSGVETSLLPVDSQGQLDLGKLKEAMRPNTVLVSIMAVNNEIGSCQDVAAVTKLVHAHSNVLGAKPLVHSDMVQALGKIPINLSKLDVDAASFSGHKISGPKGVGALYIKARSGFKPFVVGGGQEMGLRSGTQNVMGVWGFVTALELAQAEQVSEAQRLAVLRDYLYEQLCSGRYKRRVLPTAYDVERKDLFAPHVVSVTIEGLESETLVLRLDKLGFAVSGASACSSGSLDPSHVLSALSLERDRALCSLRISLGLDTNQADVDALLVALDKVID